MGLCLLRIRLSAVPAAACAPRAQAVAAVSSGSVISLTPARSLCSRLRAVSKLPAKPRPLCAGSCAPSGARSGYTGRGSPGSACGAGSTRCSPGSGRLTP